MPPQKDYNKDKDPAETNSTGSNPIQDLAEVLQELLKANQQQSHNLDPFQLDTQFKLPKFNGQSNGEAVDYWIRSLSTYFNTCLDMTGVKKLQIEALQHEGIAQVWWDTEREKDSFLIEIGATGSSRPSITKWDQLCETLRNQFYPPGYLQSLWFRWHQLRQHSIQGVQACIDYFCKLRLLLQISYRKKDSS